MIRRNFLAAALASLFGVATHSQATQEQPPPYQAHKTALHFISFRKSDGISKYCFREQPGIAVLHQRMFEVAYKNGWMVQTYFSIRLRTGELFCTRDDCWRKVIKHECGLYTLEGAA